MTKLTDTHFLMYYSKQSGGFVTTTPRLWAHANSHHFKNNKVPRTITIEKYLINNFGFKKANNSYAVLLYNFNSNIPANSKGQSFI